MFVELRLIVGEAVDDSPWIRPSNKAMKLTGRKGDERCSFCEFLSRNAVLDSQRSDSEFPISRLYGQVADKR